jgi:K+ transporter
MALAQNAIGKAFGPLVLLGVISGALVYGDAVITPALSVLSVPPSPLLSARSKITTYLSVTVTSSAHRIKDSTPSTV